MREPKPAANLPKRPTARRYVNAAAERLLRDCFPGLIPAVVIEEALRQLAIRDGRLTAPAKKGGQA